MKIALTVLSLLVLIPPAPGDIRFSSSSVPLVTFSAEDLLSGTAPITVNVSDAQIAVLRQRWPDGKQINQPTGAPTDTQLVQAFLDFGLAGDVGRVKAERVAERTKRLDPVKCAAVAQQLGLTTADLPCGGGQ